MRHFKTIFFTALCLLVAACVVKQPAPVKQPAADACTCGKDGKEKEACQPTETVVVTGKPVIYLYPAQAEHVSVKLHYAGNLTVTYPAYQNGWSVRAYPDGRLVNKSDNREYSYLFWEGIDRDAKYDMSSGFIVKGSDTEKFLQDSLARLGLTPKEYNEFIVYWLPRMMGHPYNLIHFAGQAEYAERARLQISPKPDSLLRVQMIFKKLDRATGIVPQELSPFKRSGFTVVEWGATELK